MVLDGVLIFEKLHSLGSEEEDFFCMIIQQIKIISFISNNVTGGWQISCDIWTMPSLSQSFIYLAQSINRLKTGFFSAFFSCVVISERFYKAEEVITCDV